MSQIRELFTDEGQPLDGVRLNDVVFELAVTKSNLLLLPGQNGKRMVGIEPDHEEPYGVRTDIEKGDDPSVPRRLCGSHGITGSRSAESLVVVTSLRPRERCTQINGISPC
jgi:hypothetical protein